MQPKGGSFTGEDKDYLRFVLGSHSVIPAFEEAVATMKVRTSSRGRQQQGQLSVPLHVNSCIAYWGVLAVQLIAK